MTITTAQIRHKSDRAQRRSGISGTTSFLFVQVARYHRKRAGELLGDLGLHLGQEMILEALWTRGALSQSELAEHAGVRRATMTVALRPLEKAGLVERTCDPDDRRIMRVVATEKSLVLRPKVYAAWEKLNREMISNLDIDERRVFERALRKVRNTMRHQLA